MTRATLPRQRAGRVLAACFAAIGGALFSAAPAASAPDPSPPAKRALANGLTVFVFEDARLPLVSCRLVVKSGSDHETPAQAGLAALTARATLLGTTTTDAASFRRSLEATGAEMTASASYDYSLVMLRAHERHWRKMFEQFAEAVQHPALGAAEWASLEARTLGEARQAAADPRRAADQHLDAILHGSTVYGRPVEGDPFSVEALKPEDGRRFHSENWRPHNSLLAVAGDVRAEEVFQLAERAFGAWEKITLGSRVAVSPPPDAGAGVRILDAPGAVVCPVRIGFPGPPRNDPDYLAAAALHVVLGGSRRDSRVARALADRRSTPVPLTSTWTFGAAAGSFVLAAEPPLTGVRSVIDAYREAATELRASGVNPAELALARRILAGAAALSEETPGDRAERALLSSVYGLGEDFQAAYEKRLEALEPADLQRAARRFLRTDSLAVVVVGPAEAVRSQLVDLGPPHVLPLGSRTGVVPVLAMSLPASPTPDTPEARKRAREIVDAAVAAHGGAAALRKTQSWRASGIVTIGLEGREATAPFAEVFAWPDRWRTEMLLEGSRVVRALDGQSGWTADGGGVTSLEPPALDGLRLTRYGLPLVLLRLMAEPSSQLLYVGKETRDGRPVEVVDWLRDDGGFTRAYFDAGTKLLAAADQTETAQGAGGGIRVLRLYEDLRPVSGIVHPFVTVTYAGDVRASRQVLESVELSVPVSNETFRPPAR